MFKNIKPCADNYCGARGGMGGGLGGTLLFINYLYEG